MADGAQKEAQVKLRLDSSEYVVELKRIGDMNEKVAETSRKGFRRMGKGIEAVKNEVGLLKGRLGDIIKAQLAMASGMAFTGIVGKVVELKSNLIGLQNEIERATGETVDLATMQEKFERAASKTGRTTQEMVGAYSKLKDVDLGFAENQMELVATAASATKSEVADMARLAVDLRQKFGLSGNEMAQGMTNVINAASKAGISAFELSDELGSIASAGQAAGLQGAEGMNVLLATLAKVRPRVKDIAEAGQGIEQTFERLSDPGFFASLEKAGGKKLKINLDEDNLTDRLRKILAGGEKVRAELFAATTGREELAALKALADPFTEAFARAREAGKGTEEATAAALEAYDNALREAAKSTGSYAKLQEQAARQLESPEAKLREALDKVQAAFSKPKMIEAIETVADKLPILAEALAKLVEFAAEMPVLAGTLAVGGKAGMTFAQASLAGAAKDKIGGLLRFPEASASKAGTQMAKSFIPRAAGQSVWAGVGSSMGRAAGPVIAAVIAAAIAKEAIDAWFEGEQDKQREASRSELQTQNLDAMSEAEIKAAIDRSKEALNKEQGDKPGAWRNFMDKVTTGEAGQSQEEFLKRTQKHKHFIASAEMQLQVLKDRKANEAAIQSARRPEARQAAAGKGKVEIENLGMLAHHMAQGIGNRELRVRVTNLPASGFEVEGGSRGPARPGAPSPSGGTGGV